MATASRVATTPPASSYLLLPARVSIIGGVEAGISTVIRGEAGGAEDASFAVAGGVPPSPCPAPPLTVRAVCAAAAACVRRTSTTRRG